VECLTQQGPGDPIRATLIARPGP